MVNVSLSDGRVLNMTCTESSPCYFHAVMFHVNNFNISPSQSRYCNSDAIQTRNCGSPGPFVYWCTNESEPILSYYNVSCSGLNGSSVRIYSSTETIMVESDATTTTSSTTHPQATTTITTISTTTATTTSAITASTATSMSASGGYSKLFSFFWLLTFSYYY